MSVIKVGAIQNTSGVEVYTTKAWANWNGRSTTPSIYASGNISSLTDYTTGQVALNFSNTIVDINYATAGNVISYTLTNYASSSIQLHGDRTTGAELKSTSAVKTITSWASTLDESLDVAFIVMR